MPTLSNTHLVKKRNVLNEIRSNSMTLQELRFFSIYLSKINPKDTSTRLVRFSISDFKSIMDLGRINNDYLQKVTNSLLCKVVNVPDEITGGYTGFQLFKECTVNRNEKGEWYVEVDAHDKALPLMFEYQSRYFSYQLWNALRLKSSNQLRMYEILKQYENIGSRVLEIKKLKEMLGISESEYTRFDNFKKWVLDACQSALEKYTDIKYTYAPHGKRGKGGKVMAVKFDIERNKSHVNQLSLFEFIGEHKEPNDAQEDDPFTSFGDRINFLISACNNEFTNKEVIVLFNDMRRKLPRSYTLNDLQCYDYLNDKYNEMLMRDEKNMIKNRLSYLRKLIGKDFDEDI